VPLLRRPNPLQDSSTRCQESKGCLILTALSPIQGRYSRKIAAAADAKNRNMKIAAPILILSDRRIIFPPQSGFFPVL
jgi:hypothetical protein